MRSKAAACVVSLKLTPRVALAVAPGPSLPRAGKSWIDMPLANWALLPPTRMLVRSEEPWLLNVSSILVIDPE